MAPLILSHLTMGKSESSYSQSLYAGRRCLRRLGHTHMGQDFRLVTARRTSGHGRHFRRSSLVSRAALLCPSASIRGEQSVVPCAMEREANCSHQTFGQGHHESDQRWSQEEDIPNVVIMYQAVLRRNKLDVLQPSETGHRRRTGIGTAAVPNPSQESNGHCQHQSDLTPTRPSLDFINSNTHIFARCGSVVATYRTHGAKRYGPYFCVAYRAAGRQCSIDVGRCNQLADRARELLAHFQQPRDNCRLYRKAKRERHVTLNRVLRHWQQTLCVYGLDLHGCEVRGWRALGIPRFDKTTPFTAAQKAAAAVLLESPPAWTPPTPASRPVILTKRHLCCQHQLTPP